MLLLAMQIGKAVIENSMEFPQIIEKRTTLRSTNTTVVYISNRYEIRFSKISSFHVNYSIIHNSKDMETT